MTEINIDPLLLKNQIELNELLIKRIIGTSDELKGLNFAGYVSVVNRVHSDTFSLEENDENEKKWFSENILDCIPDEYKQYEEILFHFKDIPFVAINLIIEFSIYLNLLLTK